MVNRSPVTIITFATWAIVMLSQVYISRSVLVNSGARESSRVLMTHWLMLLLQAYVILHPKDISWSLKGAGIALCVASLSLLLWAAYHARGVGLGVAFGDVVPRRVIEGGPYRRIRHPFYLSYILFWAATPLLSGWWLTLLIPGLMAAIYVKAAQQEERLIESSPLGDVYRKYRDSAGLLWPRWR